VSDRRIWTLVSVLVVAAGAGLGCGGERIEADHEHEGEGHEGGEAEGEAHHEHGNLPPALASFHEAIAPVWHSDPGAVRIGLACDNAATLRERAAAVSAEAPPAGQDADAWQAAAASLTAATDALATECGSPEHAAVEDELTAVHQAFHGLIERLEPPRS